MKEQSSIERRIAELHNGEYELISEYTGTKNRITLRHKPCGHEYSRKANEFLNEGAGLCPICNKIQGHSTRSLKEEDIPEYLKERIGDKYTYVSGYVKLSDTNTILRCNECGNEFKASISRVTGKRKRGCPICANNRRGQKVKETYLEDILPDEYTWLDEYNGNNKERLRIKHATCDREYRVRPNDIQQGWGRCPYCNVNISEPEREMSKYISEIYNGEIIRNYKDKMELDVYIPELKIGFEYNGIYWHSDKIIKDKNYHLKKKEYFKEKGIDVIFIDEYDWENKNDLVKSMISNKIGVNKKIPARKTIFREISSSEEREFLNENHIQGFAISSCRYGLYYNDELVSVISFIKGRKNVGDLNSVELLRFASKKGYTIQGGFSKLMKNCVPLLSKKYEDLCKIKTYADYSISNANVYLKNGFEFLKMSKPSHTYYHNKKKVNRYSYRKSELKKLFPEYYDDNLSEFEIINKIGSIKRVWNCGNIVLEYNVIGEESNEQSK